VPDAERFPQLFRSAPVALLRVPVLPWLAGPAVASGAGAGGDDATLDQDELADYVRRLCQDLVFRESIALASPSLSAAAERVLLRQEPGPKAAKVRRVALAVTKYRLRMAWRPTPFGLMAGVAPVTFADPATARLGIGHRSHTRPDLPWLMAVVDDAERQPEILARLRVMTPPGVTKRGGSLVRPMPGPAGPRTGPSGPELTRPAGQLEEAALAAARNPVAYAAVVSHVRQAIGEVGSPPDKADAAEIVRALVADQFLVTDLRPPPGGSDPLGYVLARLSGLDDQKVATELRAVARAIAEFDRRPAGTRLADIAGLTRRMRDLHESDNPLHADLAIDADVSLPVVVGEEVERAADVLWRLTSQPSSSWLGAYHRTFVGRYGTGRLVPLLDLLSPEIGLGVPGPGAAGIPYRPASPPATEGDYARARELERLALAARQDGVREIVLDDALVARLSPGPPASADAPMSAEVYADLVSPSLRALRCGDFMMVISFVPRDLAGSSLGRFAHLLGDAAGDVRRMVRDTPARVAGAERVGLLYWPWPPKLANTILTPRWLDRHIAAGARDPDAAEAEIPLEGLAVGADRQRLYVVAVDSGRELLPTQLHAVNAGPAAPPAARFLREVAAQGSRSWRRWDWGSERDAEFLPRLRYGRAVLHPATWRLGPAASAAARGGSFPAWRDAVEAWRARLAPPGQLVMTTQDERIPLDLDDPVHVQVLQQEAARSGQLALVEMPAGERYADGWLRGPDGPHRAELVFLLTRRDREPAPRARYRPARLRPPGDGLHEPGGDWLHAKVYAPHNDHAEILAGHLRPVVAGLIAAGQANRWFYVRYADPEPHLRLRFHGPADRLWAGLLPRLRDWMTELRRSRLASHMTIDGYDPELERYGGPEAMAAAESAFAADSMAALELLHLVQSAQLTLDPLLASALSCIDLLRAWAPQDHPLRMLARADAARGHREAFAARRREAVDLADPAAAWARLRKLPGGPALTAAWQRRRAPVAAYRARVDTLSRAGRCWASTGPITASLLHMHCNRLFGTDPDTEFAAYAIARGALVAQEARDRSARGTDSTL
jgi:thiopeptide-type bacteriocin biosynthesis protein